MRIFEDRSEAGALLAETLSSYRDRDDVLVLALPRGGVPVAWEVARGLHAPLDVMVVRKVGVPGQPELAMGAIASGGVELWNDEVLQVVRVPEAMLSQIIRREAAELERRERAYRGDRPPFDAKGRNVILVDDGIATGASMFAAIEALKKLQPARIVVAVPTAPPDTAADLERAVDEVVCLDRPWPFRAVGCWYRDFGQTSDDEVRRLLAAAGAAKTADEGTPGGAG